MKMIAQSLNNYSFSEACSDLLLAHLHAGRNCYVIGPSERHKSKLIRFAAEQFRKMTNQSVLYHSLRDFYADDAATLFFKLAQNLGDQFGLPPAPPVKNADDLANYLTDTCRIMRQPYAIFIDDVEIISSSLLVELIDAIGQVQIVPTEGNLSCGVQTVLSGTFRLTDLDDRGIDGFNQSTAIVHVADLNKSETERFARQFCTEASMTLSQQAIEALWEQTTGDILLLDLLLNICVAALDTHRKQRISKTTVEQAVEELINSAHSIVLSDFRVLELMPTLLTSVRSILDAGSVGVKVLPVNGDIDVDVLSTCGLLRFDDISYTIKSPLWEKLLRNYFTFDRVANIYATEGDWSTAFQVLSAALQRGELGAKQQLFSIIMSALRATETLAQSLDLLGQGLQAFYPDNQFTTYARLNDEVFTQTYPVTFEEKFLYRHQYPRAAFQNEFTSLGGDTFIIPLRVMATNWGVVVIKDFLAGLPSHARLIEIQHLTRFLGQVAQVLEVNAGLEELLENAHRLDNLSKLLITMLSYSEAPRNVQYQIILKGLTDRWALGFDQALLLVKRDEHLTLHSLERNADNVVTEVSLDQLTLQTLHSDQSRSAGIQGENTLFRQPLTDTNSALVKAYTQGKIQAGIAPDGLPGEFIRRLDAVGEYLVIPLQTENINWGVIYLDNSSGRRMIRPERRRLAETFVNQAARVLGNLDELARKQVDARLLNFQQNVTHKLTQSLKSVLDEIVLSACELFDAECAVLYTLDKLGDTNDDVAIDSISAYPSELLTSFNTPHFEKGLRGLGEWILRTQSRFVEDIFLLPRLATGISVTESSFIRKERIRAFIGIRLGEAENPLGIIFINWRDKHVFSGEDKNLTLLFTGFVEISIRSALRYQDDKVQKAEWEGFERFFTTLNTSEDTNLENVIGELLRQATAETLRTVYLTLKEAKNCWTRYWMEADRLCKEALKDLREDYLRDMFEASNPEARDRGNRPYLAVPVNVVGNCMAVLHLDVSLFGGENRLSHNQLDRQRLHQFNVAKRLAKQFAIRLRQFDYRAALTKLREVSAYLVHNRPYEEIYEIVVTKAVEAMRGVDAITLYRGEVLTNRLEIAYSVGIKAPEELQSFPPYGEADIMKVWSSDVPIFNESWIIDNPFCHSEGIRSSAAFPLRALQDSNERVGCMFFNYRFSHQFEEEEKSLLSMFAEAAANAIQRARLYHNLKVAKENAERIRRQLEMVDRITQIISSSLEPDEVFRDLLKEIRSAVPQADNIGIVELDEFKNELVISPGNLEFYRVNDKPAENQPYIAKLDDKPGIAGTAIIEGRDIVVADVLDTQLPYIPAILATRSQVAIPIREMNCALVLESDQVGAFTAEDVALLKMIEPHAAIALKNARQYRSMETQKEQERLKEIADLATGVMHDLSPYIGVVPELLDNLRANYSMINDEPLSELEDIVAKLELVSNRLAEFIRYQYAEAKLADTERIIKQAIKQARPFDQNPQPTKWGIEVDEDCAKFVADEYQIIMVLKNLFINAFHAMPTGRQGKIKIVVKSVNDTILFQVKDNGKGIERDRWQSVFSPSDTTNPERNSVKVHGIGLHFCKQLVERMNGFLYVENSQMDVGTTFLFALPLKKG